MSASAPETTTVPAPKNRLDSFFEITARGSTVGAEVRGGVVTFVTMAYIVILNPIILSGTPDVAGNALGFPQVAAVTALTAGVMTMLFGLVTVCRSRSRRAWASNSFLAVGIVAGSPGPRRWAWSSSTGSSSCCSP